MISLLPLLVAVLISNNGLVRAYSLPPHLHYDPSKAAPRDPNYSWNQRQTGVCPEWRVGVGFWQHYDPVDLAREGIQMPKPQTQGYMKKHLRQLTESSFQLWSVYQPAATGSWLLGLMSKRDDGNMDHSYEFRQTPFRINLNPLPNLPDGSTTRVIIVEPGSATIHGTLKLPTVQEVEGHSGPNWQFFELWLAEEDRGFTEGRKVGAVIEYNGLSGCLSQVFQIHEVAQGAAQQDPRDKMELKEKELEPLFARQTKQPTFPVGATALARVIHLPDGPLEAETDTTSEGPLVNNILDKSTFNEIILDNGAYLKIPKCFDVNLDGDVCLEFGCRRLDGSCHRLVVYGNRARGEYQTICYERWNDQ